MSSSNSNLTNTVQIGDGANAAAITDLSAIAKGDLFLVHNGAIVPDVATAQAIPRTGKVQVVAGIGAGLPMFSGIITGSTTTQYEGQAKVTRANKQETLGYNGTAGTGIAVSAGTEYRLRVHIKDKIRPNGQRMTLSDTNYTAGTGETAEDVASKIAQLYNAKQYDVNYMYDKVSLERVSDGSRVAFAVGANAIVIKDSPFVTFEAVHGLSAGDILKFQNKAYLVKNVVSTTVVELDTPYVGISETILVADADSGVYNDATEWGFLLTAIDQNSKLERAANEPVDLYTWIDFNSYFTDADDLASSQYSALNTETTPVNAGQGYWKQVADAEELAKGYLGDTSKRRYDDFRIASNVVVDTYYDSVKIQGQAVTRGSMTDMAHYPIMAEVYIPDGGAQGDATPGNNEFLAILNGYFSDVLGFDPITFV
jgi:hypothetical protein